MPKILFNFCLACILSLILITPTSALETPPPLIIKSKYFSILGPTDLDIFTVLNKLNYDYFLQTEGLLNEEGNTPEHILAKTVDSIFAESSKILGINVYSFEAALEFLPDRDTVKVVIKNIAGVDVDERAFYLHEARTIYVSVADLNANVLGHEMAHAIISHYFGAPPSMNIQEILSGYVDYSLQKSMKTTTK
jgi:hypothetical protein